MISFAEQMTKVSGPKVASMVSRINKALDKRAAYEKAKDPNKLHIELENVKRMFKGNTTVARFYCVLNADPDLIFNRERIEGSRANLKPMRKVRLLAEYLAGEHGKINGVVKALFAATILAERMGQPWVSNNDVEKLLLSVPVNTMGDELREAFAELRGLKINNPREARQQGSQFRTAFENLGCYRVTKGNSDNLNERGIVANLDSPLIQYLAERWGL